MKISTDKKLLTPYQAKVVARCIAYIQAVGRSKRCTVKQPFDATSAREASLGNLSIRSIWADEITWNIGPRVSKTVYIETRESHYVPVLDCFGKRIGGDYVTGDWASWLDRKGGKYVLKELYRFYRKHRLHDWVHPESYCMCRGCLNASDRDSEASDYYYSKVFEVEDYCFDY